MGLALRSAANGRLYTNNNTFVVTPCRGVWVAACGPENPSHSDWQCGIDAWIMERPNFDRALVWSAGGVPTKEQRDLFARAMVDSVSPEMPMAICLDSVTARLAVNTLGRCLGYNVRMLATTAVVDACSWLEIDDPTTQDVLAALARLQGRLSAP